MKTRTIFFGTPTFAVPILETLIANPNIEIVMVITQPDTKVGRKQILTPPPIKEWAEKHSLPIFQPETLKSPDIQTIIKNSQPELIVLAAYGKIIPQSILELPKFQCLNIHPSALPKYRGASPIQSALLAGEEATATSVMIMEPSLDTGPIVAQQLVPIKPKTTYPQLEQLLATESAKLLSTILPDWLDGKITPQVQDHKQATYTKVFTKTDGLINWQKSAFAIDCQIRALTPWPGTYTLFENKRYKILAVEPSNENLLPGEIILKNNQIIIGCGDNHSLSITQIQEEGKSAMTAQEFIRGHQYLQGVKLV